MHNIIKELIEKNNDVRDYESLKHVDCKAVVDYFLDNKMSVNKYYQAYVPRVTYLGSMALNHALSDGIKIYLNTPESAKILFEKITSAGRLGIESALTTSCEVVFSEMLKNFDMGELPEKFYDAIYSTEAFFTVVGAAVKKDDTAALEKIFSVPKYKKKLDTSDLASIFKNLSVANDSKSYDFISTRIRDRNPNILDQRDVYLSSLLGASFLDRVNLNDLYEPEHTKPFGHIIIHHALARWPSKVNDNNLDFISRSVRDGADWYLAYKQATVSVSIYLDLEDRKKDPVKELEEMLSHFKEYPLRRNLKVVHAIVRGLEPEILASLKDATAIKEARNAMKAHKRGKSNQMEP